MLSFDPVTVISIMLLQVANRYMRLDMTKAQEKLILHPYTQFAMYISVIYFTTKSIFYTSIIALATYICVTILFNENHRLNVLPKTWLYKEKIIDEKPEASFKDMYKENLHKYHHI